MLKEDYKGHTLYYDEETHEFRCDDPELKAPRISKLRKKIDEMVIKKYAPQPAYKKYRDSFIELMVQHPESEESDFLICKEKQTGASMTVKKNGLIACTPRNVEIIGHFNGFVQKKAEIDEELKRLEGQFDQFDPESLIQE